MILRREDVAEPKWVFRISLFEKYGWEGRGGDVDSESWIHDVDGESCVNFNEEDGPIASWTDSEQHYARFETQGRYWVQKRWLEKVY